MKKFLISFLLATLIMIPTEIFAADYETPHTFSSGDTISADMMNELFNYIKLSKKKIVSDDLIGTWSCEATNKYGSWIISGWTAGADNLYMTWNGTIIFRSDGDGTYSYSTSTPNPFYGTDSDSSSEVFYVVNNIMYLKYERGSDSSTIGQYYLSRISNTSILLQHDDGGYDPETIICDKQNLPPTTPATLTASASGKTVGLAWTDSSTDETGFKVLRKDSLKGSYSTITTTSADATSYSDTVTAAGSFWYRVSATNGNGDSVASKVVKVDVE